MVTVLVIAGAIVFTWTLINGVTGGQERFTYVEAPGETEIHFSETGPYVVFHEYQRTQDSRGTLKGGEATDLNLELVNTATGETVAVQEVERMQRHVIRRIIRDSAFRFEIDDAGDYRFSAQYPPEQAGAPLTLVIGELYGDQIIGTMLNGLAILGATGVLIALVLFQSSRQAPAENYKAPAGIKGE